MSLLFWPRINGKIHIAYPNPNPLLLTLTLESRTLSKGLNNIFFTLFRCQFVYVFACFIVVNASFIRQTSDIACVFKCVLKFSKSRN